MINNQDGDKVSAKVYAREFIARMLADTVKGELSALADPESVPYKDMTDRERNLVKDQLTKVEKRLLKVCGVKESPPDSN